MCGCESFVCIQISLYMYIHMYIIYVHVHVHMKVGHYGPFYNVYVFLSLLDN